MREAIDTAPRNGDSVILEDAARGTIAVARWSVDAAQWIDERGTPIQLKATHWHPPQNLGGKGTLGQIDATFWHLLTPAQSAPAAAEELESFTGSRKSSASVVGAATAQSQRLGKSGGSTSAWGRLLGFAGRRRGLTVAIAACLVVVAPFGAILHDSDPSMWVLHSRVAFESEAELKQELRQEKERANQLAGDVATVRREAESQAALIREALQLEQLKTERLTGQLAEARRESAAQTEQANVRTTDQLALKQEQDKVEKLRVELATARHEGESRAATIRLATDDATRLKETSVRALDELRQALQQAKDTAERLAGELATTRQEVKAQTAFAQAAHDETQRVVDRSNRSAEKQGQALREAQGKAEALAAELEAARREIQSHAAAARSTNDEAAGVKEAAERSTVEHRQALQQERDKTSRLAAELVEVRSALTTQAKAKAAEEAARDDQLAALREELQKAKVEATTSSEALDAERARTHRVEQQLASIRQSAADRDGRSPAAAAFTAGQPATAASEGQTKPPAKDVAQAANSVAQPEASVEQGDPHAVRLIARANLLLDQGNIGAARNVLDRAAQMGSPEALFWLAETYDPLLLSARKTFGTQSNIVVAMELYSKALAGGVDEARLRLEALQRGMGSKQ
jgi:hypothetical protein